MSEKNPVIMRTYYYVKIELASPISIHGSENYYSDGDIIVDGNDEPFIPGTSIAGALRGYLEKGSKENCIYGFSAGEDGRMSSVFTSDMYFNKGVKVGIRDHVALEEGKTVKNKFDIQMIETGAGGTMRFEYVKRSLDKYDFEKDFVNLIFAIDNGDIRFGADKTRGFGRIRIIEIAEKSFDKDLLNEWKLFDPSDTLTLDWKPFDEWKENKTKPEPHYIRIGVPLKLKGGISIRKYSTRPGEADYEHMTCNDVPIIPGSSWNGAVRSDAKRIMGELGCSEINEKIDEWFGYVKVKTGKGKNTDTDNQEDQEQARQSMIVFGESVLEGAVAVPMTRNKINRFTGGTVNGALYSEISYFGGTTLLEILIKKDRDGNYKPLIGLVNLIINDLDAGYVAVGGQTAVGRGIFGLNGEVSYSDGTGSIDLEECIGELANVINGGVRK